MKIVAVVPIKLNNTRLPQKNTRSFTNGEPLCTYVLRTLQKVCDIDEIYVYCSNPDIVEYLPEGVKFLRRSEKFDTDETSMNEILISFMNEVDADIYVMTHTTAPFISENSISKGIVAVKSGQFDSAFAVERLQDFFWKDGKPCNYKLDNIPRTQDLKAVYMETSGFYIYTKKVIKKLGRRIGEIPFLVEVNKIEAIDIDEQEDFELADAIFNFYYK